MCIRSAKGRRWLVRREVDLEKNAEMSLASHCLAVLGEVEDWDLHASDGQIEDYPIQVIPSINGSLPILKQGFGLFISSMTNLLFTPSPAMLIIDKVDYGLTSLDNGITGCL